MATLQASLWVSKSWRQLGRPSKGLQSLLREIQSSTDPFVNSFLIYGCRGDHILKRHSGRVEDNDFVRRCTSGFCSGNDLAATLADIVVKMKNGRIDESNLTLMQGVR